MIRIYQLLFAVALLLSACTPVQHVSKTDIKYTTISKDQAAAEDAEVNRIIAPYKAQLDAVMNEVLGQLPYELSKKKPESTLGNWITDVMMHRLKKDNFDVDLAVVNYGGLRVPYLTQGPLTRGELFELAPFENMVVIVDVPGEKLDSFFLLIAESDGWPISKEAKLVLGPKKVNSALVHGQPVVKDKIYKVATVDYVANGGDNMKVMIPLSRIQTNLIFRDILIDYVKEATAAGIPLAPTTDGRIIQQ